MKKALAVLAVLAVAAAAQADMLASWGSGGVANGTDLNDDGYMWNDTISIGVKDLEAYNGGSIATYSSTAGVGTRIGNMSKNDGAGIQFAFTVLEDHYIEGATMDGIAHATAAGPKTSDWYVGETKVGSITAPDTKSNIFSSSLGNLEGSGTVKLVANLEAGRVSGTGAVSGNLDLMELEMNGQLKEGSAPGQVPEPATMSLLGLGVLAMALRRKLRK